LKAGRSCGRKGNTPEILCVERIPAAAVTSFGLPRKRNKTKQKIVKVSSNSVLDLFFFYILFTFSFTRYRTIYDFIFLFLLPCVDFHLEGKGRYWSRLVMTLAIYI